MTQKTKTYKFTQIISAPPPEVYAAFTNAAALCEWLCNVSQADAHERGRLYLWWNNGYYAVGEFITLKLNQKICFSWHGRGEPGITHVKVALKPTGNGLTKVKLEHIGFGKEKSWRETTKNIKRVWRDGLENLKSVLESGEDLRIIHRPLLGITGYDLISVDEISGQMKSGIRIHGIVDGMGAHHAGLQKNDIIVKLGSQPIDGQNAIENVLAAHRSGEKIKVQYYRDGKRRNTSLILSQRPIPEIPRNLEELENIASSQYHRLIDELELCMQGITESQANFRISETDWSPQEVLAHLIAFERETQSWIANLIEGQEADLEHKANTSDRIRATITTFPETSILLAELKDCMEDTTGLLAALPAEFVRRRGSFWRVGYAILDIPSHFENHINQIRDIVAAAQTAETEEILGPEHQLYENKIANSSSLTNDLSKTVMDKG